MTHITVPSEPTEAMHALAKAAADATISEDSDKGNARRQREWYVARDAVLYALSAAPAYEPTEADVERVLSDPAAVHLNMLRGGIAKPSIANIIHLYGADALRAALSAMPAPVPQPSVTSEEVERVGRAIEQADTRKGSSLLEEFLSWGDRKDFNILARAAIAALRPTPDLTGARYEDGTPVKGEG